MLPAAARSIWSEPAPVIAQQLRSLWPTIRIWEFGKLHSLGELLKILRSLKPDNPKFRENDTAALWAARYYYYRVLYPFNVYRVNRMMLPLHIGGKSLSANYHIYWENSKRCGYIYFKYGKQWNIDDTICTLSLIRAYHEESHIQQPLFNLEPEYRYVNLLIDDVRVLEDEDYSGWRRKIEQDLPIMEKYNNG